MSEAPPPQREPGLYPDIPEADYHADDSALSASGAKILLGKRPPDPDGHLLVFGTLVHRLLLEHDRTDEYVLLDPSKVGLKADGTPAANPTMTAAWKRAAAEAAADGKTAIPTPDWDKAHRMVDAVHVHPFAAELLAACPLREVTAYGTHELTGAPIRGRFDLLGENVLADLKTTGDADPEGWGRRIAYGFGYYISAANYIDLANQHGHPVTDCYFINVEREPTADGRHRVSITTLDASALDQGAADMTEACRRWLAAGRVDLPDYPLGPVMCDLPPWAYRNHHTESSTDSTLVDPETPTIPADFEWSIHDYA